MLAPELVKQHLLAALMSGVQDEHDKLDDSRQFSLWVGLSGGVDSIVLLHCLSRTIGKDPRFTLRAIHVNHGLSPNAAQWQQLCQSFCEQHRVPLMMESVIVKNDKTGLEDAARQARYTAFNKYLQCDDFLVLGHHMDDQAETFLFRLMRGTGVRGLGGMQALSNTNIVRPMLSFSKQSIIAYAEAHGLAWVHDESNEDTQFSRNYLRKKVIPVLEQKWPHAVESINRASRLCAEAELLNQDLAKLDWQLARQDNGTLQVSTLSILSAPRQRNLLRFWIAQCGFNLPSEAVLDRVTNDVIKAANDSMPRVAWGNVEIRRFKNQLVLQPSLPELDPKIAMPWDLNKSLPWQPLATTIQAVPGDQGLHPNYQGQPLTVRVRQGGERCRPAGRHHSQSLKKLFQEYQVPPWLRDRWPLLFCDDQLIAVLGVFICDEAKGPSGKSLTFRFD